MFILRQRHFTTGATAAPVTDDPRGTVRICCLLWPAIPVVALLRYHPPSRGVVACRNPAILGAREFSRVGLLCHTAHVVINHGLPGIAARAAGMIGSRIAHAPSTVKDLPRMKLVCLRQVDDRL